MERTLSGQSRPERLERAMARELGLDPYRVVPGTLNSTFIAGDAKAEVTWEGKLFMRPELLLAALERAERTVDAERGTL